MERREFLKTAGAGTVAAAASLTIGAPAVIASTKTIRWKATSFWNPKIKIMFDTVKDFCQNVKEMSDGQLDIKLYGGGELVPPFGAFDAVSKGTMQMGTGSPYFWAGKNPAFNWFGSIPFGMNAQSINAWFYEGNGMNLMTELYDQFNLVPRVIGNSGVQMGGWFRKEIKTVDDLSGLKMRIPGLAGEVFAKLGVNVTNIPAGELYTSLDRGTIDALEWVGPGMDIKMGFHKVAPFYYTGWHEPASDMQFLVNKRAFDKLPAEYQAILKIAMKAASADMYSENFDASAQAWSQMEVDFPNIKVKTFPIEVLKAMKKATDEVLSGYAAENAEFKTVYDSQKAYMAKGRKWTKMSDYYYIETSEAVE